MSKIQKHLQKCKRGLIKSTPTILTCVGGAGVVITSVLTAKATIKAVELLNQDSTKKCDSDENVYGSYDIIKTTWRCYVPVVIVGGATLFCIFGANALSKRNQASIISAYALLEQSYKKYRDASKNVFGEDAEKKIKVEMAKDVYISNGWGNTRLSQLDYGDEVLFYDDHSMRYFTTTMASVLNAEYHFNRNLALRGVVTANEFYTFLGIEQIDSGDDIGWCMEDIMDGGYMWLDFDNEYIELEDGMECCRICTAFEPILLEEYDY